MKGGDTLRSDCLPALPWPSREVSIMGTFVIVFGGVTAVCNAVLIGDASFPSGSYSADILISLFIVATGAVAVWASLRQSRISIIATLIISGVIVLADVLIVTRGLLNEAEVARVDLIDSGSFGFYKNTVSLLVRTAFIVALTLCMLLFIISFLSLSTGFYLENSSSTITNNDDDDPLLNLDDRTSIFKKSVTKTRISNAPP